MALVASNITRSFKYNGMTLADPSASKTPDQVRAFFAAQYPELTNAVVEGPVTKGGISTYTFARAAGSKGAKRESQETVLHRIVAHGLPNTGSPLDGASVKQLKESFKCSQVVSTIMNNRDRLTPLHCAATAYSMFG